MAQDNFSFSSVAQRHQKVGHPWYFVNPAGKDYIRKKNKWMIKIKEWVDRYGPGALVIPFSGALELKVQELSMEERKVPGSEQDTKQFGKAH